jgi:hypothetical protein
MTEFRMAPFRRPKAPSLQTFARVMLGTRLLGFLFAVLWATDGFVWWKLLVVFFTGTLVVLQVRRVRVLDLRRARLR